MLAYLTPKLAYASIRGIVSMPVNKYVTQILAVPSICSIIGNVACFSGLWLGSGFLCTGDSTGLADKTRKISSRQNEHFKKEENQLFNRDNF